jgi:uncharacterized protein (DUF849 family)
MMREYSQACRENNTKPELEVWDLGQISAVKFMLDRGYVSPPLHLQFVLGALSGMVSLAGLEEGEKRYYSGVLEDEEENRMNVLIY